MKGCEGTTMARFRRRLRGLAPYSGLAGLLALAACFLARPTPAEAPEDHYWRLGTGYYFGGLAGGLNEEDVARFDWLYVCLGNFPANQEGVDLLNRLMLRNPRQKLVLRVWPILGLGDCPENRYQATFLHFLYVPEIKEKVLKGIHDQIRFFLDHLQRPENVVGLTFLEELPNHFSGAPFFKNETGEEVSWDLARFRKEIEAERGQPLRWDDETRIWWGRQWGRVMDEIHAEMKKASQGRLVFYYQQTNHSSLDMFPDGQPLRTPLLMPVRWTELIRPGLCDGFFAYPNNAEVWEGYLRLAREHGWLIFAQVAHPPYRLCAWEETMRLAKMRLPYNLGYFFYCEGSCAASGSWNVDQSIPSGPEWDSPDIGHKLHVRRHLAAERVGMDVLERQPAVRLHWDLPLRAAAGSTWLQTRVIVEAVRQPSCYLDPVEAVARQANVTLEVPPGFRLDPRHSAPKTIELGDLTPGKRTVADWWVTLPASFPDTLAEPFKLTGAAEGSPPVVLEAREDTAIPFAQPQRIGASGTEWMEAPFRLARDRVQPAVLLQALHGPVKNPAVSDGLVTLGYEGTLDEGTRLVMHPENGASLSALPLLDDDGSSRSDAKDSTGYRCYEDGYMVLNLGVGRTVRPDVPIRITLSGRGVEGGQSLAVARFTTRTGTHDESLLANGFAEKWGEASAEIRSPPEAVAFQNLFLYRFQSRGKVWYGPVKIERTDVTTQGVDVTTRVRGSFPTLTRDGFRIFRYTDENTPSSSPRVLVQLLLPPP